VTAGPPAGPVLFAYDGSELAKLAIQEAGRQLAGARQGLVLTVWQPFDVGFLPSASAAFDAQNASAVAAVAKQTAAEGAGVAQAAGFRSEGLTVRCDPTWKGVVEMADDRDASLIVLGSHGRTGLTRIVLGSVARAVAAHSRRSVLIVHRRP
jgi:nucleotide-binding universal stress UspA family protein